MTVEKCSPTGRVETSDTRGEKGDNCETIAKEGGPNNDFVVGDEENRRKEKKTH